MTSTPGEVPSDVDTDDIEQTTRILVAGYDGLAPTTQLSETCELTRGIIIGAMKVLTRHGLVMECKGENWGIADVDA